MPKPPYIDIEDHVKFVLIAEEGVKSLEAMLQAVENDEIEAADIHTIVEFSKNNKKFIGFETDKEIYWSFYDENAKD